MPKSPRFDPGVKRLAVEVEVEVEDHPIAFAQFEGDIEEGYGKGHVDRFDQGVWSTDGNARAQLEKGHLQFELFGQRLKGRWHLVRSGRRERQPAWFLIKAKNRFAGPTSSGCHAKVQRLAPLRLVRKVLARRSSVVVVTS